jgi:hypothetical protein
MPSLDYPSTYLVIAGRHAPLLLLSYQYQNCLRVIALLFSALPTRLTGQDTWVAQRNATT